jgi:hypothetical protein
MRNRLILTILCLLALLATAQPVHAAPNQDDEVILGDDLTLREGERIDGDLVLFGGNLTMEAGSRVQGSVTLFGGSAEVNGRVDGDLVAMGGDVALNGLARVGGDTVALGGRVRRAPGAQAGDIVEGTVPRDLRFWRWLQFPFALGVDLRPRSILGSTLAALFSAIGLTLLGVAVVYFWPNQTTRVGETVVKAPLPSLGVGCWTYPLAASFTIFVLITICLAPFAPVMVLAVVAASLFGWIALGRLFGRWLARATGWRDATPLAATAAGVFVLSVLAAILGAVPCLGALIVISGASIGLGAVALSRFGTTPFPRRPAPEPPVEA